MNGLQRKKTCVVIDHFNSSTPHNGTRGGYILRCLKQMHRGKEWWCGTRESLAPSWHISRAE